MAVIEGVSRLHGVGVQATDLRGGAALMIAALSAEGESRISEIRHIERGYEGPEKILSALSANIKRIDGEDGEE
jgi:UDP-N-acetylglucosamine 1-carboxyvinyltransferase